MPFSPLQSVRHDCKSLLLFVNLSFLNTTRSRKNYNKSRSSNQKPTPFYLPPPPSPVDAPYTCCIFLLCLRELWCSGWAAFAVWQATTKIGLSNVSLSIAVCGDQRNWQIQRSIHFWSIWCCDLQDPFPHDHAPSFSWIHRFPIMSLWIKRQPFLPLMKLSISASRFQSYYIDALNW